MRTVLAVAADLPLITGEVIDEEQLDEEICVVDRKEVAVNINTVQELKIAENLFTKRF